MTAIDYAIAATIEVGTAAIKSIAINRAACLCNDAEIAGYDVAELRRALVAVAREIGETRLEAAIDAAIGEADTDTAAADEDSDTIDELVEAAAAIYAMANEIAAKIGETPLRRANKLATQIQTQIDRAGLCLGRVLEREGAIVSGAANLESYKHPSGVYVYLTEEGDFWAASHLPPYAMEEHDDELPF